VPVSGLETRVVLPALSYVNVVVTACGLVTVSISRSTLG
jgi:hypothetical protein